MKALVGAFNQEKALVGAFSVIVQPVVEPMDRFTALSRTDGTGAIRLKSVGWDDLNPEFLRKYICQHKNVKTVAGKHLKINFEKNKDNHHLKISL